MLTRRNVLIIFMSVEMMLNEVVNLTFVALSHQFIVNRIGDFGLAIAIMLIWTSLGTLQFSGGLCEGTAGLGRHRNRYDRDDATAVGGHRQKRTDPLFGWLPDAMEGPTPVSALIHAATMVTAGAVHAGALGCTARPGADHKHLGGGPSAWSRRSSRRNDCAHPDRSQTDSRLFNHLAARLYVSGSRCGRIQRSHLSPADARLLQGTFVLGSGSVMHAFHGELDIRKMGNLRKKLPVTYWTFPIGAAALAGIPLFSGFFSKDEILVRLGEVAPALGEGFATAVLTAI